MSLQPRIIISNGALGNLQKYVRGISNVFAIVTDQHLRGVATALRNSLRRAQLTAHLIIIPPGEKTKSLSYVEKIARSLLKLGVKRDGCLIGLGGGVVGDLTGFLAAIYLRGIPFISIPTTTLAMGDSSVGGKTGVDLPEGKNLIGTFAHPKLILMDPLLLRTLPDREFRSGLSEIVKHAIIADRKFFDFLEKNSKTILARQPKIVEKIIRESIRIKLTIVRRDERESVGVRSVSRMLLNYGHTVGHALEQLSDFQIPHGEAVSIGMVAENRIAVAKKNLKESEAQKIEHLLKTIGLPTRFPQQYSPQDLNRIMERDKKLIGGKLYFSLPLRIGKARLIVL